MKRTKQSVQMLEMIQQQLTERANPNAQAPKVHPRVCILTGRPGEDPDDCTTHDHEGSE